MSAIANNDFERLVEQSRLALAPRARELEGKNASESEMVVREVARDVVSFFRDGRSPDEEDAVVAVVLRDFMGYGALQPYLDDDDVTEIMVNSPDKTYIEVEGVIWPVRQRLFASDAEVMRLIDRIAAPLGKRCDVSSPVLDARLPDGSRVNASIPPISRFGPNITIRKFSKRRLDADALVEAGTVSEDMMRFLACAIEARCNILVSGGTGTGKTTMLNVLCSFIPSHERVVTIEDVAELQLTVDDWISQEARAANADGMGEVTIHDLVVDSLRKRPDRIIVGECRSTEAFEMLQAMNTGHEGSLTTIHANDPRGAFSRITDMIQQSENIAGRSIDRQIATAIQLVVQLRRYRDGTRKVSEVVALTGNVEGDAIVTVPLFTFQVDRFNHRTGKVEGRHIAHSVQLPKCIAERIEWTGAQFDRAWLGGE